jgi:hypothetical protein
MKSGDWIARKWNEESFWGEAPSIGKLKGDPYPDPTTGETLGNVVLYNHEGKRIGRESDPCGGPTAFEPSCNLDDWVRIAPPSFPLQRYFYSLDLRKL